MTFCPNCMAEIEDGAALCPKCGGNVNIQNQPYQLPVLSILHGRYLVGRVLGAGGFGITYMGYDLSLEFNVAIKEYYPQTLAGRYNGIAVTTTGDTAAQFAQGRREFLDEAKRVHQFYGDENIVRVIDVFYENNTAYMVMEYIDGSTLSTYMRENGCFSGFDELYSKLRPVMLSLSRIHDAGIVHRDISPSNLMIDKQGKIRLIDFGTARNMNEEGERSVSVVLKHGFAPPEQYTKHGRQGAWTDVYAMCATIYKLLTGVTPDSAPDRSFAGTELKAPSQYGVKITAAQEQVLKDGMALQIVRRIPDMKELIRRFDSAAPQKEERSKAEKKPEKSAVNAERPAADNKPVKKKKLLTAIIAAALVLAAAVTAILLPSAKPAGNKAVWEKVYLPVKETWYDENGEISSVTTTEYDDRGWKSFERRVSYYDGSVVSESEIKNTWGADGTLEKYEYSYKSDDSSSHTVSTYEIMADGTRKTISTDDNGTVTEHWSKGEKIGENKIKLTFFRNGEVSGIQIITTEETSTGRTEKRESYDENGQLTVETVSVYDKNGNLLHDRNESYIYLHTEYRRVFEYDSENRIVKASSIFRDIDSTYTYESVSTGEFEYKLFKRLSYE